MAHPVLVHCLAGSGKTAIFLMIASTMAEIDVGGGGNVDMAGNSNLIPNMVQMAAQSCQQRKGILKEKEHFKQAVMGTVRHAKDILIKKGKIPPETMKIVAESSNPENQGENNDTSR